MRITLPQSRTLFIVGICLLLSGLTTLTLTGRALAQDSATPETMPEPTPEAEAAVSESEVASDEDVASDAYCLLCHSQPDQVWTLPSGESLSVSIDPAVLGGSVHGASSSEGALGCNDCHPNFRYPHPATTARTIREFQLERYAVCRDCHADQYTRAQDSVHGAFLRAGHIEAAVCVDCHGGHDIQPPDEPRQRVSLTCGRCHGAIFEEYSASVHGQALLGEDNPDVPTCIDCHGVHDIANPTTVLFRTRSPELCAECHADTDLMGQYDINPNVFDTYLTDFHGSTVALFEGESEGGVTNKAVCYDCHGVHNIQPVEDGTAIRETLVTTCRTCHPDASADFSNAWIGHYPATADSQPALFAAGRLYDLVIPLAVIFPLGFIASEFIRRLRSRR